MGRASLRDGIRHNIPCTLLYLFLPALVSCCVVRVWRDKNDIHTSLIAVQYSLRSSCIKHEA